MTQIHPKNLIKYLYHLILCYGKVECENSAFSSRCFMNAMRKSKLITNEDPQQSATNLQRKVLLEEHVWLPIRGNALGKRIKASKQSLSAFFNNEQLEASCPLVSELMIKQEAETRINDAIHNQKKTLVNVLWNNLQPVILTPTIEQLMAATKTSPCAWRPYLEQCAGQTIHSYLEQKESLKIGIKRILIHLKGK